MTASVQKTADCHSQTSHASDLRKRCATGGCSVPLFEPVVRPREPLQTLWHFSRWDKKLRLQCVFKTVRIHTYKFLLKEIYM